MCLLSVRCFTRWKSKLPWLGDLKNARPRSVCFFGVCCNFNKIHAYSFLCIPRLSPLFLEIKKSTTMTHVCCLLCAATEKHIGTKCDYFSAFQNAGTSMPWSNWLSRSSTVIKATSIKHMLFDLAAKVLSKNGRVALFEVWMHFQDHERRNDISIRLCAQIFEDIRSIPSSPDLLIHAESSSFSKRHLHPIHLLCYRNAMGPFACLSASKTPTHSARTKA